MKSLRARLADLEERLGQIPDQRQVEIVSEAIDHPDDADAQQRVAALRTSGKGIPFLLNVYDLWQRGPAVSATEHMERSR